MPQWTRDQWMTVLPQARIQGSVASLELVTDFFVDSRQAIPQAMFVPIKGERTDGHRFIPELLERGTQAFFCAESAWSELVGVAQGYPEAAFVLVPNVLEALAAFAAAHLDRFPATIRLGVSGSNGKTTTKELLAAALAVFGPTYATVGNLNSEIGLPLTALRMGEGFRFAVFEMGINHRGEMDILASVVRPLVSVLTNIGTAHIGIIGSQHEIALEKKKIFSRSGAVAYAVLPAADPFLPVLTEGFEGTVRLFGWNQPGYRLVADHGLAGSEFEWKGTIYTLALPGRHNIDNALAVLTTVEALGLDPRKCRQALAAVQPLDGRSQVVQGRVQVFLDCYNANFDSMVGLLELLASLESPLRKVLVLGSMRELGERTEALHQALGQRVARQAVEAVFYFGPEAETAYNASVAAGFAGHLLWTADYAELEAALLDFVQPGDLVALKGSRSLQLERLKAPLLAEQKELDRVL